jgi:eukaryotic-like serine/threonine-protein kinase
MALTPGTRLGQYEIRGVIGAGGMGDVFRARDPRLDREVAIKVLSAHIATRPGAITRFEREAMSVAKLSHPNIVSIFEFGVHGDTVFVVTELLDGETLRARLRGGALPPRRAVAYALQITRGMAAAHARGMVHRDLKPENVMITRADQVKILDFGLAKTLEADEPDSIGGAHAVTRVGAVLGTSGYMAPEQARGQAVDHRADIFAFGAVLYEMLSGERAFKGANSADTMMAVLTEDPPELHAAGVSISPALDRIVRRCLEKTPDLRFQSADDLAFALETLSTTTTSSTAAIDVTAPARHRRGVWLPWIIMAIAVAAAAASWLLRGAANPVDARWDHFTRISESAGEETSPSLSPDGTTVAYSARVNGNWNIYSQRVGGRNATPIVNDPQRDERGAAYSPDGSLIAFHESDDLGGVFVAGATGESVRRVTDVGFDPAWSPDAMQVAFATEEIADPAVRMGDSTLYVVAAAGGTPRRVVEADAVQPFWSPSGERLVYWSNTGGQRDIYTVAAAGGTRIAVTQDSAVDWSPVWSPDGRFIYFSSDRGGAMNLWRIAVDESSGRPLARPEPVTTGVQASATLPRFSRDGSRLAFRSRIASVNPVAIPFDAATTRAGAASLLDTQNNVRIPSDVSPDGTQIAFYSLGDQQEDIFIGSADGRMRRVTDDAARDRAPVFTPDGRSLVFYSNRDRNWALWMVGVDGGNLRKVAGEEPGAVYASVSPKGDMVIFVATSGRAVFSAPLRAGGGTSPTLLRGTQTAGKYFTPTAWSPDGTRLAGPLVSESGRSAVVGTYDLARQSTTIVSNDEAFAVKWLADSRRIIYFTKSGSELVVLDTVTRKRTVVDVRLPGPATPTEMFALTPDNRTIYYGAARTEADIWIAERK